MVRLFNEVRRQPSYIYALVYLHLLDSNCTICKYLCYYIRYLFLVIQFSVDPSNFHIYYIAIYVVMSDSPNVFLVIINVHLSLFNSGYNLPVYN